MEGDLHDLLAQKEELDVRITELQVEAEHSRAHLKTNADAALYELLCKNFTITYAIIIRQKMSFFIIYPKFVFSIIKFNIICILIFRNSILL